MKRNLTEVELGGQKGRYRSHQNRLLATLAGSVATLLPLAGKGSFNSEESRTICVEIVCSEELCRSNRSSEMLAFPLVLSQRTSKE